MANPTMTLIASVTVGSGGAASMDFTSIPSTYTDLCVKISSRGTTASSTTGLVWALNTLTTNFSYKVLYGDGTAAASVGSSTGSLGDINASTSTTSTFSSTEVYLPNYGSSNNKSYSVDSVQEQNGTTAYAELLAGLWSNTSAVNAIKLQPTSGNFAQYSTAYLYGISNT